MAIQFAGLGSGLPINDWITQLVDVKKMTTVTPLETKKTNLENSNSALSVIKTSFTSLQTSLKALQQSVLGTDVWNKATVTSSNSDYVTATSTSSAKNTNTTVKILQLATNTTVKSANSTAKVADADTKFKQVANGTAKEGTFTFYVDNSKFSIEIGEEDTLGNIADKINEASGGRATAGVNSDGTFKISVDAASTLSLGSTSDTSNFKSALQLNTHETDGNKNSIVSAYTPSLVSTTAKLASENSGFATAITLTKETEVEVPDKDDETGEGTITEIRKSGTIKINGQEFTIDESTTMSDLLRKINDNKDAKVNASYDTLTNKLTLTSTETGSFNIALEQENTNFFDVMGLMNGDELAAGTQTVGKNAEAMVNGNKVVSSSNTLTSSSTGITGLTISLLKEPAGDDAGKEITLQSRTSTLESKQAMQTFIDAYNKVADQINEVTKADGYLEMDSGLRQIMQSMRSMVGAVYENDGDYNLLAKVGLTTYKTGDLETESRTIKIDNEKLNKAFDENFDSLRMLMTNTEGTGFIDKMLSRVNETLDTEKGYFKTKSDTISKQIKTADASITKATALLEAYKTQLTRQFNYMDKMIANLNSQYSAFTSSSS